MKSETEEKGLLRALGGEAGCKRLAQAFYARVATNPELKPLFPGKSFRCATEEFAAFLIQFLGGDEDQTQYRWWLSLRESHARFQITESQRTTWLTLMAETLDSSITDAKARRAFAQFFQATSTYVVGQDQGEVDHPELSGLWNSQRALEQVIDHLANGRDKEAIGQARRFASRPSVYVGILARMMEINRELLLAFVLDSIQTNPDLAKHRFNGRTLLHFSAALSCPTVVQSLLSNGVDPNIPDNGGHSPLYRAAGSRHDEQGSRIVEALVQAGADVDRAGGVNRSTPLHAAARRGNLRTTQALLKAGANPNLKDRNGYTPLDRARNCRKAPVTDLLSCTNEHDATQS